MKQLETLRASIVEVMKAQQLTAQAQREIMQATDKDDNPDKFTTARIALATASGISAGLMFALSEIDNLLSENE